MRVTVIVPARDAQSTIGDCAAAVLSQDYPREDFELVVVDDGSTDRTAETARGAGARVISISPSGPAAARNRGAAAARGEVLVFTDADCAPDPGWLRAMVEPFAEPEVTATKGTYRSEQRALTARFVQLEYESRYRRMARRPSIDFIDTYSAAFRRDLYLACGGCDESFRTPSTEDQELGFRYHRQGGAMRFVPGAVVRHLHADSPGKYFRKKLRIGFHKARVLERHPAKAVSDAHTPLSVKLEMALALVALASIPLLTTPAGPWPLLCCAAGFAFSAAGLVRQAFRRGAALGLAAVGLLPLRALALGLGLAAGLLSLVLSWAGTLAIWGALVIAAFLAASRPMLAATGGFLQNLLLLACIGYLALFAGFRLLRLAERRLPAGPGAWDPLERTAAELGLGIGAVIALVFALGLLGLYRAEAAFGLLAVLALGRHRPLHLALSERWRALRAAPRSGAGAVLWACLLAVGAMTLFESLAPAAAQDALAYHLAVPAKYIEQRGMVYIPESFFAQFPGNVEMLFTLALLLRGAELAGACHWLLGVGAVLAAAALARRLVPAEDGGVEPPGGSRGLAGLTAAALLATVPTVALVAGWAYVDLGLVFFELLSVLAFVRWWRLGERAAERRLGWLVLSGTFAGLAAGVKYTGGAQGLLIAGLAALEGVLRRRRLASAAGAAALAALVTGAVASPWWIKNLVYTGNPLYPFLYGVFGGRDWDADRAAVLAAFLRDWGKGGAGLTETLLLPWRLTMSARFFSMEHFDGVIGPAFLIGAPAVLAAILAPRRETGGESERAAAPLGPILALALGHAVLWLGLSRQIRFLLPALACGSALIGALLPRTLAPGRGRSLALGALQIGIACNVLLVATHFASHNPLPVVLGLEQPSRYLAREVPGGDYPVFQFIAESLPPDSFILFGGSGNPGFLSKRRYHADAIFENRTLAEILGAGRTPGGVLEEFRRRGFTHLLFRGTLVFDPSERRSGIPLDDQLLLGAFLNRHASLLKSAGGTFLYRVGGRP